jgi:hypothetical protein
MGSPPRLPRHLLRPVLRAGNKTAKPVIHPVAQLS